MIQLWFIAMTFALELGITDAQSAVYTDADIPVEIAGDLDLNTVLKNEEFSEFKAGYALLEVDLTMWDVFYVGGGIKTAFIQSDENNWTPVTFQPTDITSLFNVGFRLGPVNVGFRHVCVHPAAPHFYKSLPSFAFDSSYEEIFIRIEG